MGQLLLIGSQIGYSLFEYKRKNLAKKSRDLLGGRGVIKRSFWITGGGGLLGAKKGLHDF